MKKILMLLYKYKKQIAAVFLMAVGLYLIHDVFTGGQSVRNMEAWLKDNGDSELNGYSAHLKDEKDRQALGVAFMTYKNRFGKGAWVQHFLKDNPIPQNITYTELAELAIGISSAENREKFLEEHAKAYDACIKLGMFEEANKYVEVLKELREKGGRDWNVVEGNTFAICVYEALREKQELWEWYLKNYKWCDPFLVTHPLDDDSAELGDVVLFLKEHHAVLEKFHKEISSLTKEEMYALADGDDEIETEDALYASCLAFVGNDVNRLVLETIQKVSPSIPMLEAMQVVANNIDVLEDCSSLNDCRTLGVEFASIWKNKEMLWDISLEEYGAGVIKLNRQIPQYCEEIVASYGPMNVIAFLRKYYNEYQGSDSIDLLRVAAEILYKCKDPGWAVLQKFRDNEQFKGMMLNKKIGFRIVPYYLKEGDKVFSELHEDPRWIDEVLDKNGHLKRKDVEWYEVSDIATVVKKMAQGRPITAEEIGWAAFEAADLAAMAFTGGASKALTGAGKAAAKKSAKMIGRRAAKGIAYNGMRKLQCNLIHRNIKQIGRHTGKHLAKKTTIKNVGLLKKIAFQFKKIRAAGTKGIKATAKSIKEVVKRLKNLPPETKRSIFKTAKTLLYVKFFVHTLPDKGPDFVRGTLEKFGETLGKMAYAVGSGVGDGFKAAIREVLGMSKSGGKSLLMKIMTLIGSFGLILLSFNLLFSKK